jgi:Protein of unknown function (DUF2938)
MKMFGAVILTGMGATLAMDLGALLRRRLSGSPFPNYAFVGRWIAHLLRGQLRHESIAASPAVRGERTIGWVAHYAIGVVFASLLLAVWGAPWFEHPTPAPALLTGVATILAPFLILQPALGAGIAASRTPRPGAARLQSLINHMTFGFGLYAAALLVAIQ